MLLCNMAHKNLFFFSHQNSTLMCFLSFGYFESYYKSSYCAFLALMPLTNLTMIPGSVYVAFTAGSSSILSIQPASRGNLQHAQPALQKKN